MTRGSSTYCLCYPDFQAPYFSFRQYFCMIFCVVCPGFPNTLSHSSSGHALGLSHPHLGQLNTQQRAPLPYPGQVPSSLNGSLGYSANLSSAGSDRASPSSLLGRTNLAAHMGFGSNPNLQSLDQLQTRLPQREQLTWQQQLLAQQQHQAPYDLYGFQSQHADGVQNHHSHHLPAVPMWQNPTTSFQQDPAAALGHIGHPASPNLLPQRLHGSYPMQLDSLGPGEFISQHLVPAPHSLAMYPFTVNTACPCAMEIHDK